MGGQYESARTHHNRAGPTSTRVSRASSLARPKPLPRAQELASRQDQQPQLLQHLELELESSETEQQRNQWVVLRLYEAINGRDHAAAGSLLASDLEWWYHGPPAHHHMMRLLTGAGGPSSSSFKFKPISVDALPASDVVVAEGITTAGGYWVHAWTVGPNGVITHLREYFNTDLTVTRLAAASSCLWQSRRPDRHTNALPALLLAL
uniref:Wound-induced protein 1 n=1 Tax=Leersia perrieri TaxID=77586 RepID=A0A0D9X377_9ORYZ